MTTHPITIRLYLANGERLTIEGQRASWTWWERWLGKPLIVHVASILGGLGDRL